MDRSFAETGNPEIKERRRRTRVPVQPGGVVGDYVPFYFAPLSPMLFEVARRRFLTRDKIQDRLVYLVSRVSRLRQCGAVVVTDRNAAKVTADFRTGDVDLADVVDWPLMTAQYWHNTETELDRKERGMAELLVHRRVPLEAMTGLVVRDEGAARILARHVSGSALGELPLRSYPQWYFDEQGW
jgi:ssDNA thymidine ADP-ribosyltransferase, DarT